MSAATKNVKTKKKDSALKNFFKALFGGGRNGDMSLSFFAYVMILLGYDVLCKLCVGVQ